MIQVQNLTKTYGSIQALHDVSFSIEAGEIVGLLGPNGAGKTTTIKTLTGYLQPGGGDVRIDGLDVLTQPREVQAQIGYLPESAPLYPELSVQGYLKMMADLRDIPKADVVSCISDAVRAVNLDEHLARPIGELSKGFRQRVGLAQAILHRPQLLILDEPTVGLDPTQIVEIRSLIRRLAENSTILFSTHILSEVEALCDRVIILINGQIKADAKLSDLSATANAILILQKPVDGLKNQLGGLDGVDRVEKVDTAKDHPTYRIFGKEGSDLCPAIYDLAREQGWPLRELHSDQQTLETVFNQMMDQE